MDVLKTVHSRVNARVTRTRSYRSKPTGWSESCEKNLILSHYRPKVTFLRLGMARLELQVRLGYPSHQNFDNQSLFSMIHVKERQIKSYNFDLTNV